jgi:hypothetical protein
MSPEVTHSVPQFSRRRSRREFRQSLLVLAPEYVPLHALLTFMQTDKRDAAVRAINKAFL